jgi:flagellin
MKIQTNTSANNALRNMSINASNTERSIEKLSSGFRINRSGDDAAGLAIANKLRADGKGLAQAQRNTSQGTAMLQVMDGATQTIAGMLDRMKELASSANSASIGDQANKLNDEFTALRAEVGRIVNTTEYQGTKLVNGSFGATETGTADFLGSARASAGEISSVKLTGAAPGTITFSTPAANTMTASIVTSTGTMTQTVATVGGAQTLNFNQIGVEINTGTTFVTTLGATAGTLVVAGGAANFQVSSSGDYANSTNGDLVALSSVNLKTDNTGLNIDGLDLLTSGTAQTALTRIDTAIGLVGAAIGTIGAAQSRFDFAAANVATMLQNVQAAESTIRDADMAYEMTQFTKNNILQQAAQSMLAQANSGTQGILQLLRG